jgi:hypothetical protein
MYVSYKYGTCRSINRKKYDIHFSLFCSGNCNSQLKYFPISVLIFDQTDPELHRIQSTMSMLVFWVVNTVWSSNPEDERFMLLSACKSTQSYKPEDQHRHLHCQENFKSLTVPYLIEYTVTFSPNCKV